MLSSVRPLELFPRHVLELWPTHLIYLLHRRCFLSTIFSKRLPFHPHVPECNGCSDRRHSCDRCRTPAAGFRHDNQASISRQVFAFAKDPGMPFSDWLACVDPRWQVPQNSIFVNCLFTIGMSLINIDFDCL